MAWYALTMVVLAAWSQRCFCNPLVQAGEASPSATPATDRSRFDGFEYGDPQNCPQTAVNIAEVLPGTGWDNLRNKPMGHVIAYNYTKCRIFQDKSFLLPDGIYAIALKKSNVETFSELMTHFSNYTSVTSDSINVGAKGSFGFGSISGSFSRDYQKTKMHITGDRSTASRVQLRYEMYTLRSEPDPPLHPSFKDCLRDIASALQANDNSSATYLAQLLVRDYGSHYVTSVTAGAGIARTDQLNSSYINDMNSDVTTVKASASASFFKFLGIDFSITHTVSNSQITKYRQSAIDSKTVSYGGPPVKVNFSLDKWVDEIDNNLVALDRDGDPLWYAVTPRTLPELPLDTIREVADTVQKAVESYYQHNVYQGCTDVDAPNFNNIANFDDNTCHAAYNNYTFGGVYQTCEGGLCGRTQINPKTGKFSCPHDYKAVLLRQETKFRCVRRCDHFWFVEYNCYDDCSHTDSSPNAAHYELYWCAATSSVPAESGYLFGGVYTDRTNNMVTQDDSCPSHYTKLTIGWDNKMHICVSDDYELGFRYAVKFAGLFSCVSGNPLAISMKASDSLAALKITPANGGTMSLAMHQFASGHENWPKRCPQGYSQHLWLVDDGCAIHYCVVMNALTPRALPVIRRPPYQDKPKILNNGTQLLITAHEEILMKHGNSPAWQNTGKIAGDEEAKMLLLEGKLKPSSFSSSSSASSSSSNAAAVTVLAIIVTIVLGAIVIFVVFKVVKHVKGQRLYRYTNEDGKSIASGQTSFYGAVPAPTAQNTNEV